MTNIYSLVLMLALLLVEVYLAVINFIQQLFFYTKLSSLYCPIFTLLIDALCSLFVLLRLFGLVKPLHLYSPLRKVHKNVVAFT